MEIVCLLVGFAIAVLVVPPRASKAIQRKVRRKAGDLIRDSKNKNNGGGQS